jgi:phosphate transport system substrate-binding protein
MKNYFYRAISLVSVLAIALGLNSCGGDSQNSAENSIGIKLPFQETIRPVGAGASFPATLYKNWFVLLNQAVPQLQFDFQSVGSGAGIERFTGGIIDFGASDIAMTDEQIAKVKRGVLMLPMTAGSIVLGYNLPEVKDLKLSREVYVNIFLGNITNWNDPKIAKDNPGVTLPNRLIAVVHRSDGSGTTAVFTRHLNDINPAWEKAIGTGTAVQWPTAKGRFIGGRGNEGVAALVSQTPGSIGFMEYGFATKSNLSMASLENKAGKFVAPSNESGSATLAQVELPPNLRAFISDPPGEGSYPIVTYTWMLLFKKYDNPNLAIAMEAMIQFGLTEGQKQAGQLGFIELPQNVKERIAAVADEITPDFKITLPPAK